MPRRIPIQVAQTVGRLLQGGYLKSSPAWYDTALRYPATTVPPRAALPRPDSDLPRSLQGPTRSKALEAANQKKGRSALNSAKKMRSQLPNLRPLPIVYEADRIRRQFFRDHPWEAKRASTLVEMDYALDLDSSPEIAEGHMPELYHWSRLNPNVEDVIQCTQKTSAMGNMSLSDAYRRTLATYHAIQAEREHRIRYANYEARYLGADLGPSETDRGFVKEQRELDKWAALSGTDVAASDESNASGTPGAAERKKRVDTLFSGGQVYLSAAARSSSGQTSAPGSRAPSPPSNAPEPKKDAGETSDFLGIANALS
ncbi:mitochondrial ribosomal small subunit component [Malassezia vespertilionis]|uniref:Small ribosomal subunit protein mS23 n=1 Tax=Malassezia vespertilionis TaxID=2020962 RepID=A0A2N1J8V2_9BASI|nr:mitochondrial ribosomal small subunit component [Malassezia vespertilionis]PKI82991.1 Rsm25p [Malassezia vespertilionis]WFD07633.1 mitochondrial ribosomal small subunit component [Malassezia vespertilionis]